LATSLSVKGKGRGKKSSQEVCEVAGPSNEDFADASTSGPSNLRTGQSQSHPPRPPSNFSNFTEDRSERSFNSDRNMRQSDSTTTTNIYIKRLDCFLNSVAIDQIEDKQNEDECIQAYWKLFQANGQINSMVTNGISYDDFRNGYFFAAFDLSTSGKSGTGFVVPSIR
jgi:hypothetical protein